jgi:hypothetical protein
MLEKSQDLSHPLFSTPELVSDIVGRLLDGVRRDLFALALVSKVFSQPALDGLCYKLRTFEHLINLLPEDAGSDDDADLFITYRDTPDAHILGKRIVSDFTALTLHLPTHEMRIAPCSTVGLLRPCPSE